MSSRVLVTGAAGNLGRKAVAALGAVDGVRVLEIDRSADDHRTIVADLAVFEPAWAAAFDGVDTVLHLAGESSPAAPWASVVRDNVDATLNVFRAATAAGVGRVVFASSNWVLGGHRFGDEQLTPDTPPRPVNPYGASKLFGERAGCQLAATTGCVFVALRIGYCQTGDNVPGPHMGFGRWGQEMWLSNDDWASAAVAACTPPGVTTAVVNVMSDNEGMRWDLAATERALGWSPRDGHRPTLSPPQRITEALARARDRLVPRHLALPRPGSRW